MPQAEALRLILVMRYQSVVSRLTPKLLLDRLVVIDLDRLDEEAGDVAAILGE